MTSPCRHGETKTGSLLDLEIIWFGVGRAPQKRAILISLRKLIQAYWISFQFEHDISMIKIYQNECVEQSQGAHRPTAWCAPRKLAMWHVITLSATKKPIEYVLWIIAHGFLMRIYNQRMAIMTRIWIVLELITAPILLSHALVQAYRKTLSNVPL